MNCGQLHARRFGSDEWYWSDRNCRSNSYLPDARIDSEMLRIRSEQITVFEEAGRRRFNEEMVEHSKNFAPPICEVIGDEQLRVALRSAMTRAENYGFTYRGPIRLFIEMMFLCGSAFDTDPQYPAVGEVLRAPGDQMQRAQQIHEGYLDYFDRVSGPGGANVHKALKDLLTLAKEPNPYSSNDLVATMLHEMKRIFPQKAAYVGETNLKALISEGLAAAHTYGFSDARSQALMVILKYAFGHGCTDDPLYPWISRTLKDEKIVNSAARAARLEKKAITWLEHVVARNEQKST